MSDLSKLPVRQKLSRMKWIPEREAGTQFDQLELEMNTSVQAVAAAAGGS
ncbi:MAG TPA: hypothetical protein VGS18_00285 [Thermoplasmata archaeon]|nr:hypothetical protein [Thermoplasmata archaeon]